MTIPHHHSTEPTPGERGAGFGRAQAERIARTVEIYDRLFEAKTGLGRAEIARFGDEALDRIGAFAPDLADEIEGIAQGSGVNVAAIAALNARTELLCAGRGECSTIACLGDVTASGEPIGMQTWDWHDAIADSWVRWTIDHPDGHRVETMTEAGIVGKIGVSSAGVGVLLNILGHRDDGPPLGIPVHVLTRTVLDRAANAVQALEILTTATVSASSAATVVAGDEDGGAVCAVELSPAGPGFVTPDDRGILVHTNHFVAEPGRSGDTMVREGPDSVLRLDHARRAMARLETGNVDEDAILGALRSHRGGSGAICCHPAAGAQFGDRWATLATITVEPVPARMTLRRGGPCQAEPATLVSATA
ncbi:MAG: isopenicillin-N N-acyltransferase like protein [Gaiellales bacterium]|jgi:isopenicillin-N N-acyltransferase-like protein|nr:isopenicillin-N N-acyltransferase like protein [Gaiellales bacterium]